MKDRGPTYASSASAASPDCQTSAMAGGLRASDQAFRGELLLSPVLSIGRNGLRGQTALRPPSALHLHPAFNELNLAGWLINSELKGKPQNAHEPILITQASIILGGFAEWHAAVCAGQPEINCVEFALNADEALQLVLTLHRPRNWNDFTRTELALEQEQYFQSKAVANQIAGGKHKGLANLPKAQHIDVREKIADLADVCSRTVGNVKTILKKAHPAVVEALHNGTITINRAVQLCGFAKCDQVEELARLLAKGPNRKVNREYIDKLQAETFGADIGAFLANLQQFEAANPGSVEVHSGTGKKTLVILGKDHLNALTGGIPAGLE
jgi:hypothetical protein